MADIAARPLLLGKYLLLSTAARDPKLHATALGVLAAILERYNDREGCARPGATRLAKDTGRTRRNCQHAVELLIAQGYLDVERGNRRANKYRPQMEKGVPMLAKTSVAGDTKLASPATPQLASPTTPEPFKGIHSRIPLKGRDSGISEPAAGAAVPQPYPSPSGKAHTKRSQKVTGTATASGSPNYRDIPK